MWGNNGENGFYVNLFQPLQRRPLLLFVIGLILSKATKSVFFKWKTALDSGASFNNEKLILHQTINMSKKNYKVGLRGEGSNNKCSM